jgi:hypothetical protein
MTERRRAIGPVSRLARGFSNRRYSVSDRCDGTLTQVDKGRVSVRSGKRTKTVRAGQRYLIKARLFAARRKGS